MSNILIISSFEYNVQCVPNDGYTLIATSIGNYLTQQKHRVVGCGISYTRNQHNAFFGINQVAVNQLPSAIRSAKVNAGFDHVIIVLDISLVKTLIERLGTKDNIDYTAVFAVEGDPIQPSWAMTLSQIQHKFPISKFGQDELEKVGIESTYLPYPIKIDEWPFRTEEKKQAIKDVMGVGDKKIIFANADNNERKNLGSLIQAMQFLPEDYHLYLLTRKVSPIGWTFEDLIMSFDVGDRVTVIERGLDVESLWKLYAMADIYVNCSFAEGLCIPVLEAMAVGVPVLATDCTALTESIADGKGISMKPVVTFPGVFGNAFRYVTTSEFIALQIVQNIDKNHEPMITKARSYVEELAKVDLGKYFDYFPEVIVHESLSGVANEQKEQS